LANAMSDLWLRDVRFPPIEDKSVLSLLSTHCGHYTVGRSCRRWD